MIHVVISKGVNILAHVRVRRIDDDGRGRSDPRAERGTYAVEAGVTHAPGDRGVASWVLGAFPRRQYNALGLLAAIMRGAPDSVLEMEWEELSPGTASPGGTASPLQVIRDQIKNGMSAEEAFEEVQRWNMARDELMKLNGLLIAHSLKTIFRTLGE